MSEAQRHALDRAEELERRAREETDDVAYCLKWAAFHRHLVATVRAIEESHSGDV